jgi:hypothetical protein
MLNVNAPFSEVPNWPSATLEPAFGGNAEAPDTQATKQAHPHEIIEMQSAWLDLQGTSLPASPLHQR